MRRTSLREGVATVLYAYPRHRRGDDRDYHEEIAALQRALAHGGWVLEIVELSDMADFLGALSKRPYDIVVIASRNPWLGLFECVGEDAQERTALAFAEQLALLCAPNAWILLMACGSSWLTPQLAKHGLWGVSFDDEPIPSSCVLAFLRGFFSCVGHDRSRDVAYDIGYLAVAYADLRSVGSMRLFGPGYDLERGHHYEWFVENWPDYSQGLRALDPGQTRGSHT